MGRIYKGNHILNIQKIFLSFLIMFMEANDPGMWPVWTPGAWLAEFM